MKKELVIVLDFGGQYNQLVARRVRECNVYCEIYSYKTDLEKIKAMNPKGIILTGGPNSCYEPDSPTYSKELFELGIPVLGLCYGAQLMMHVLGGKVEKADHREYGKTEVLVDKTSSKIFEGVSEKTICWMSHFDYISQVAPGFEITSHTDNCPCASSENAEKGLYAIQFHPEVLHTQEGSKMLYNFVRGVCGCCGDWRMDNWGVEENAQFVEISDDIEEKKKGTKSYYAITYNFDTVNGTCYKVLKALSHKFKNLKFKWRYASESYGKDTGSYLFKGDREVRKNYKEGSDKAILHSMWCWGEL